MSRVGRRFPQSKMQKTNPPAATAASIFSTFSSFIKTDQAAQPRNVTPLPNMTSTGNSGDFFIRVSLDLLQNSKEMRRNEPLKNAISAALGETLKFKCEINNMF